MHGPENVEFVNAQQAKQICQYKKVHLVSSLLRQYSTMHGSENVEFANAQQAKQICQFNIHRSVHR